MRAPENLVTLPPKKKTVGIIKDWRAPQNSIVSFNLGVLYWHKQTLYKRSWLLCVNSRIIKTIYQRRQGEMSRITRTDTFTQSRTHTYHRNHQSPIREKGFRCSPKCSRVQPLNIVRHRIQKRGSSVCERTLSGHRSRGGREQTLVLSSDALTGASVGKSTEQWSEFIWLPKHAHSVGNDCHPRVEHLARRP